MAIKIKKGDKIKITKGKDRGKEGVVEKVLTAKNKVIVGGLNLLKKNIRPKKTGEKGQIVSVPSPLNMANIMLICPKCGKVSRVGFKVFDGGKARECKKCGGEI